MESGVGSRKSTAPDHPSLVTLKSWGALKNRKMVRILGISPPVHIYGFNNDIDTLVRGIKERVFYVKDKLGNFVEPPRPNPNHFARSLLKTRVALWKLLPSTVPVTRQEFVDSYRGRKKELYQRAHDNLMRRGFRVSDSHLAVFTKYEKTLKDDAVARIVSPRKPEYNVELGRFLKHLEKRAFVALDGLFDHPTVLKGYNSAVCGRLLREKWMMFKDPVAVGLDASRFDQHVSKDALLWEHEVYLECFKIARHKNRLKKLLQMQLVNKCVGRTFNGTAFYTKIGGRMSGDMNTSLGNCVLMVCMVHAYLTTIGINGHLANNGDDCVVFIERSDLEKFSSGLDTWFLNMGFSMKVETPVDVFEQLEFCQTQPVWVGPADDYIMVRNPITGLAKDTMCIKPPLDMREWYGAVGTGGLTATGGIPIWQDFYKMYTRWSDGKAGFTDYSWGHKQHIADMRRQYGVVHPYTRASFYWAFGITPCEQEAWENVYKETCLGDPETRYRQ